MRVSAKIMVTGGTIEGDFEAEPFKAFFLDVIKSENKSHSLWKFTPNRTSFLLIDSACVTNVEIWSDDKIDFALWVVAEGPSPGTIVPLTSSLQGKPPADPGPGEITLESLGLGAKL